MAFADYVQLQYDSKRSWILNGGDHVYQLHTSILGANHQIRDEASAVFKRKNMFVRITASNWRLSALQHHEMIVLSTGSKAHKFPNVAMTLDFDATLDNNEGRGNLIFASNDIPSFCTAFLCVRKHYNDTIEIPLRITIDSSIHKLSKQAQLLEPFRALHSINIVQIDGPGHEKYKTEIIESMGGRRPSAKEIMNTVSTAFGEGNTAYTNGYLTSAITKYKISLDAIRGSSFDSSEEDEILNDGPLTGMAAGR